jgi:hypothetical protein
MVPRVYKTVINKIHKGKGGGLQYSTDLRPVDSTKGEKPVYTDKAKSSKKIFNVNKCSNIILIVIKM